MSQQPYYSERSIVTTFFSYLVIGGVVCFLSLILIVAGLYTWATTVNTCKSRERYSVLSMMEQTLPFITRPIQARICPSDTLSGRK